MYLLSDTKYSNFCAVFKARFVFNRHPTVRLLRNIASTRHLCHSIVPWASLFTFLTDLLTAARACVCVCGLARECVHAYLPISSRTIVSLLTDAKNNPSPLLMLTARLPVTSLSRQVHGDPENESGWC